MAILDFIEDVCVQTAVYWAAPTIAVNGEKTFPEPVEIPVRWDGAASLIRKSNSEEIATVATIMVTQDVDEGGYLYLGELYPDPDPNPLIVGHEIVMVKKTPLFKSTTEFVITAYVK